MSQPSHPEPSHATGRPSADESAAPSGRPESSGAAAATLVRELAVLALEADGTPPFSDQALVEARSGEATVLGDADAAAIVRPALDEAVDGPFEAELVVAPTLRGAGLGTTLLGHVVEATSGDLLVWAHGDHPAAARLAAHFGFEATRRLLQQRAPVLPDRAQPALPDGFTLRAFRPGTDDAAWLDLNARAFASHPEQGALDQDDLDARKAEAWFDAGDLLLLSDEAGTLAAFCWLKIEGATDATTAASESLGEFYAVGVAPERQGEHLGGFVVDAGLARLAERGVDTATLYVEGDNTAALRLYAARGFTDHAVDVQYTLHR